MEADQPAPKPPPRTLLRRRTARILIGIAVVVAVILLLAPYGIRYGLQHWLLAHGANRAVIDNVDFNPFTGHLVLEGVEVSAEGKPGIDMRRVVVRFDWLPLWRKRLRVDQISLQQASLAVSRTAGGVWRVGGVVVGPPGNESTTSNGSSWGIGVGQLDIDDLRIQYSDPAGAAALDIADASLGTIATWEPQRQARVRLQGTLDGAQLRADVKLAPFAAEPHLAGDVHVAGLALQGIAPRLRPTLNMLNGKLTTDSHVTLHRRRDGSIDLTAQGTTSLTDIELDAPAVNLTDKLLTWDGTLRLTQAPAGLGPRLTVDGTLASQGLKFTTAGPSLDGTVGTLDWQGHLNYGKQDVPTGYELHGKVVMQGLDLIDSRRALTLLEARQLQAQDVVAHGTYDIALADLQAAHLRVMQPLAEASQPPLLKAAGLQCTNLQLKNLTNLAVDTVQLRDAIGVIRRDAHGRWYVLDRMHNATNTKAAGGTAANTPHTEPPTIRIDRLHLAGNSQILFRDATVKPPYETTMRLTTASLERLNNARPDEPSPIKLAGHVGTYSTFTLKGTVKPFAQPLSLDVTGAIKQLSLPPLSPYAAKELGYNLTSGQLDAKIKLRIAGGKLDGASQLAFNNLTVAPQNEAKIRQLQSRLNMPLDAALSMLRDKNNDIHLKLPISGKLDNPQFNLGDTINQALGRALRVAAVSYVKFALQPYGAIITAVQLAGKATGAVQLQPVLFKPGSATLDGDARQYMTRIAALLKNRPQLRLKLCGKAVNADRAALRQQAATNTAKSETSSSTSTKPPPISDAELEALAHRRAAALKQYLVSQLGTDAGRLFLCHPEVDTTPNAEARVQLLI